MILILNSCCSLLDCTDYNPYKTTSVVFLDTKLIYNDVILPPYSPLQYLKGDTVQVMWEDRDSNPIGLMWVHSRYNKNKHLIKSNESGMTLFPAIILN